MKKNRELIINFFDINLLLILVWMGVIFYFSSLQGSGVKYNPPLWFFIERKGAHIGEYFILTLFLINFFIKRYSNLKDVFTISALVALLYAFTDEIHQLFVFGREGKITDVGFDSVGIILALTIFGVFIKVKERFKK
jgi:VanZ family protein